MRSTIELQKDICKRFGATHFACSDDQFVYFALESKGYLPVNGERVRGKGEESGWYIWCGAHKKDSEAFFQKVSVYELSEMVPLAYAFLGLPPGFKFLIAGGHQRAWLDENLLAPSEVKPDNRGE